MIPHIPSSAEINKFKTSSLAIGPPPGFNDLDNVLARDITTMINLALASIDTNIDFVPIDLAGNLVLPLKDLKIYTSKQSEARWLLENKH